MLFGDYDVDGVTSLALLAEMLRGYGATPELFLPLRMEEGYGLSRESVERCLEQHRPRLLIAIDCGTPQSRKLPSSRDRGVDVIVLDHHEPKSQLPDCVAIVNPKADSDSPFHYLCSVGIVFKLCHALLKTRPLPEFDLKSKLDLVALGTVADIVPLVEENRVLVQRGAIEIGRTSRVGLRKLMQVAGVRPPILPEDIGYRLGPRLNAAGRLSTAEKSLRLLLTNDEDEAAALATELDQQNRARQEVEKEILAAAIVTIEKQFDAARDAAIVAGARGWHPGVLGIVASRIARKYHRPTIVIGFDENGVGKGSGRSIEGLNLVDALTRCAATLGRNSADTKWQPVWRYTRKIFRSLLKRFAVPRASYFQKKPCNARCDWITSCRSQISMSNFSAGTNFCSRSEMEIRSHFSLRVRSSPSGRRESQTKSI